MGLSSIDKILVSEEIVVSGLKNSI